MAKSATDETCANRLKVRVASLLIPVLGLLLATDLAFKRNAFRIVLGEPALSRFFRGETVR